MLSARSNLTLTCVSLHLQLSDVEKGGSTVFLKSGISVSPLKVPACLLNSAPSGGSLVILEYYLREVLVLLQCTHHQFTSLQAMFMSVIESLNFG